MAIFQPTPFVPFGMNVALKVCVSTRVRNMMCPSPVAWPEDLRSSKSVKKIKNRHFSFDFQRLIVYNMFMSWMGDDFTLPPPAPATFNA